MIRPTAIVFFTEVIESRKTLEMEPDVWEKLFSKKTKKNDGKFLLPREWTRVFSKKIQKSTDFAALLLTDILYRRELPTYFLHHFVVKFVPRHETGYQTFYKYCSA